MNVFQEFITLDKLLRLGFLVLVGIPGFYMLSNFIRRYATKKLTAQLGLISSKVVLYIGLVIISISVLSEMGWDLTHLFAAAGILGIAIGFASQTSMSNVISGLFLIGEQPFVVGDVITVEGITGEVLSIDMLSIKIREFDNKFVRIPNETIVKSAVTNLTHFPIRRVNINVSVAYKEDVSRVKEVLYEIASANPLCLQEPAPVFIFTNFGNSSIDLLFGVWAEKEEFLAVKNSIQEQIKARFEAEGIEIPFPHVSLYTGSVTQPFPVQMVEPLTGTK